MVAVVGREFVLVPAQLRSVDTSVLLIVTRNFEGCPERRVRVVSGIVDTVAEHDRLSNVSTYRTGKRLEITSLGSSGRGSGIGGGRSREEE
jgi:hypothetical protein